MMMKISATLILTAIAVVDTEAWVSSSRQNVGRQKGALFSSPSTDFDISVPYDAAAQLAYESSDKSMPYDEFQTQYEAEAIALVKSKQQSGAEEPVVTPAVVVPAPTETTTTTPISMEKAKANLLHLGAVLDRGQAYNPTSGGYYAERMQVAREQIAAFLEAHPDRVPQSMADIQGEWELVLSTVPHGIFRSSPFFLAVQEAFDVYAENKVMQDGTPKSTLFFKLHELQTMSWGVSKVGRVAQHITPNNLYSEFDTSIFSLTVIPILGWFKLLPTFGGCVITAAKASMPGQDGVLEMVVDYTTSRPVSGLNGLGEWIWSIKVPVGGIWKLLPWNKGREAVCQVTVRYCDDDFRIVEDRSGDMFVYTRPVVPRPLDLVEQELQS